MKAWVVRSRLYFINSFLQLYYLSLLGPHQLLAAVRNSWGVQMCNSHMSALADAREHSFLHVHCTGNENSWALNMSYSFRPEFLRPFYWCTQQIKYVCKRTLHSLGTQVNKTPYFGRKVGYAHLQPRDPGGLKNYNKKNSPQYIHHNPKWQQYYFPITFTSIEN